MTLLDAAVIGVILGLGAMLQSAVGFGMALVAIPLLVLGGRPLPEAVALVLGAALVQTAYGTYVTRKQVVWRRTFSFAAIQWVALVAGVACMSLLVGANPAVIKQTVGAALFAIVTAQIVLRPHPRERLARGWTFAAAGSAGFIAGLVGMGGPPVVLFALAHRWSRDTFRGFLWSQFLLVLPILAVALVIRFGTGLVEWLGIGVATAPVVWLGSRIGLRVTQRWDSRRLHVAAVIMLYAIALASLFGPYLG
jgi:uncharacterized membrane protein YfcA